MRVIRDKITAGYYEHREDFIELFLALQKQNFIIGNSLKNLVDHWPHEEIFLVHSSQGIPFQIQSQE